MTTTKFKTGSQLMRDVMFPPTFRHLFEEFTGNEPIQNKGSFFRPGVEIIENEASFEILLSLPGMTKEEIKIEMKADDLVISGERVSRKKEENGKIHLSEMNYGSFSRSFYLPENIDKEKIEASYADGILTLHLPKGEEAKPKTITIG